MKINGQKLVPQLTRHDFETLIKSLIVSAGPVPNINELRKAEEILTTA